MAKETGKLRTKKPIYSRGGQKDVWSSAVKSHHGGKSAPKHIMKGNKYHRVRIRRNGKTKTWKLLPQWEYDQLTTAEKRKLKEEFDHWRGEYGEAGFVEADSVVALGLSSDDEIDRWWYENYDVNQDFMADMREDEAALDENDYWLRDGFDDYQGSGARYAKCDKINAIQLDGDCLYRLQVWGESEGDSFMYECYWLGDAGCIELDDDFCGKTDKVTVTSTPTSIVMDSINHVALKKAPVTFGASDLVLNETVQQLHNSNPTPLSVPIEKQQENIVNNVADVVQLREQLQRFEEKERMASVKNSDNATELANLRNIVMQQKVAKERLEEKARGLEEKVKEELRRNEILANSQKNGVETWKGGHNLIRDRDKEIEELKKMNSTLIEKLKAEEGPRHAVLQQMSGGPSGVNLTTQIVKPFISSVSYELNGVIRTALGTPRQISSTNPNLVLKVGKADMIGVLMTPLHTFDEKGPEHSKPSQIDVSKIVLENISFTGPGNQTFRCDKEHTQLCLVECHCSYCNNHCKNDKGHMTKSGRRVDCLAIIDVRLKQYFRTAVDGNYNPHPQFIFSVNGSNAPTRFVSSTDRHHIDDGCCESRIFTQLNTDVNAGSSGAPIFIVNENKALNVGMLNGVATKMGIKWSDGIIFDHLNFKPLPACTGSTAQSRGGGENL